MTDERTRARIHERRHGRPTSFYERALAASDRDLIAEARAVDGMDDEVALLRVLILRLLEEQPADTAAVHSGIRLLVQALATRHRLSGRESGNLTDTASHLLEQFTEMFADVRGEAQR